jgi:hypothetical protein
MVCADPDSSQPQPLQLLRVQVQEALSASVHHAALAQQYLAAARRFSELADVSELNYSGCRQHQSRHEPRPAHGPSDDGINSHGPELRWVEFPYLMASEQISAETMSAADSARECASDPAYLAPAVPSARTSIAQLQDRFQQLQQRVTATGADGCGSAGENPGSDSPSHSSPAAASVGGASLRDSSSRGRQRHGVRRRGKSVQRVLERAQMAAVEDQTALRFTAVRTEKSKSEFSAGQRPFLQELRRNGKSAMASSLVTLSVLLLLAWFQLEIYQPPRLSPLLGAASDTDVSELQTEEFTAESQQPEPVDVPEPSVPEQMLAEASQPVMQPEIAEPQVKLPDLKPAAATAAAAASALAGRSSGPTAAAAPTRQELLDRYGGTAESEEAVARALAWLAGCQRRDGSWDFTDIGKCSRPGRTQNSIAATAYALMPFLASGQTHRQGDYREQVQAGLQHLLRSGRRVPAGLDLRGVLNQRDDDPEPNYAYYTHGAATLVLCESWYRSGDRTLRAACEEAVRFLIASQDPVGGGWRYLPQQPGSTSCTAIQIMALNSARKAGLKLPDHTFRLAQTYFDNVAIDGEGRYGYEVQKKSWQISLTAMALYSRSLLGWERTDGDLAAGVKLLDQRGPYENLYYCYFATQVMKNWGGAEWDRWNERMRDELVLTQEREGPESGSWTPRDRASFSVAGGRLLATCLSTLTLEVYYRYPGDAKDLQGQTAAVVPSGGVDSGSN